MHNPIRPRRKRYKGFFMVMVAVVAALPLASTAAASAASERALPGISVPTAPAPFMATDERRHLVYEIAFENRTGARVRLRRLEVRDPSRRSALATYRGAAVKQLMAGLAARPTRTFAPGEADVLLLDVSLPPGRRVPHRLEHRFALSSGGEPARRSTITRGRTRVDGRAPIRLSPPLRGAELGIIGCCSSAGAHRHALLERDGRLLFAQRYAIDFLRVGNPLSTFAGDPASNASYFLYGEEVIAAAPGRVVATRDGMVENTPPNTAADVTPDGAAGNSVTQELGGGRFALYAHLQPGSLRVQPGDRVQRGQVLGRVGNSGNSTEPHLHFHVMDGPGGPSRLVADGLPYVFDRFGLDGRIEGLEGDPPSPSLGPARGPRQRAGQYPLGGDVIGSPGN